MQLDLFTAAAVAAPPSDLGRCPKCARNYGVCDRRAGYFNHATGYQCSCGKPATTCQWCMVITMPPCSPEIHAHHDARRATP